MSLGFLIVVVVFNSSIPPASRATSLSARIVPCARVFARTVMSVTRKLCEYKGDVRGAAFCGFDDRCHARVTFAGEIRVVPVSLPIFFVVKQNSRGTNKCNMEFNIIFRVSSFLFLERCL